MLNIFLSANVLLSDIGMGTTLHEIVKWAIVIKHFTLEIEFASSACGFFVMCLTAMQIHNLPIQPKKEATLVTIKSYVSSLSSKYFENEH